MAGAGPLLHPVPQVGQGLQLGPGEGGKGGGDAGGLGARCREGAGCKVQAGGRVHYLLQSESLPTRSIGMSAMSARSKLIRLWQAQIHRTLK